MGGHGLLQLKVTLVARFAEVEVRAREAPVSCIFAIQLIAAPVAVPHVDEVQRGKRVRVRRAVDAVRAHVIVVARAAVVAGHGALEIE